MNFQLKNTNPGLTSYTDYRESSLQWLGKIPSHWGMKRAKWLFQKMNRPIDANDDIVTCFRDGVVTLRKNRRLRGFTESLKEIGYQGVRKGDLVIHAMDAFAGAVGVSDSDGKCTPVYAVCTTKSDLNLHYYAYIVREMSRSQWIIALAKGIRERSTDFRFEQFASQLVPIPTRQEQDKIAGFLADYECRVDKLICAKRKLIQLLNEQREHIIQRAVTGRLDPSPRLKPIAINWIAELPEHWQALQLRRVVNLVTSGSRYWAQFYSDQGDIILQSGNLGRAMSLNLKSIQHVTLPETFDGVRAKVQLNDVLVCVTGAMTGNVAIVDECLPSDAYVNQHVALVRPNPERIFPRYLAFVLHSDIGRTQFKHSEYGGTKQGLGLDDVRSIILPLPPLSEQMAICTKLDCATSELVQVISRAQREIDLILQYRAKLVSSVVTGKMDVRHTIEQPLLFDRTLRHSEPIYVDDEEHSTDLVKFHA